MSENIQSQAEKCRLLGSKNFQNGSYSRALELYTKAIELEPQNAIFYSNRAATYLALNKPDLALDDAEFGLKLDPANVKLIYRKIKSMISLKRYKVAINFLETCSQHLADNRELAVLFEKAKLLDEEASHGKYVYSKLYEEAKTDPILDHAEFMAIDLISFSTVSGITSKIDIPPGTLILASKAVGFVKSINSIPPRPEVVKAYGETNAELFSSVVDRIRSNPSIGHDFYKLKCENYTNFEFDESNPIELDRIREIVRCNNLIFARNGANTDCGIWLEPFFMSNSCADANCIRQIVGDIYFVRTLKPIKCGEKLTISRINLIGMSFDARCYAIRKMGLEPCCCSVCQAEIKLTKEQRDELAKIGKETDGMKSVFNDAEPFQMATIVSQLEDMRERVWDAAPDLDRDLNVTAHKVAHILGIAYRLSGKFRDAANVFEQNVEFFKRVGCLEEALDAVNVLVYLYQQLGDEAKAPWIFEKGVELVQLAIGDGKLTTFYFDRLRDIVSKHG